MVYLSQNAHIKCDQLPVGLYLESSRFGLNDLDLRSIQAGVYGKSEQSARVLEKCGFQKEGYFRLKLRYKEKWDDHLVYNLVNPNWSE